MGEIRQPQSGGLRHRDEDRWVLSRLNSTVGAVTALLEAFEFSKAINTLYDFFWNEFCSWYIELSKPRLTLAAEPADRAAAQAVLLHVLDRCLRLLHPFCPYVSEALWAELLQRASPAARNLGRAEYAGAPARQDRSSLLAVAAWPQTEQEFVNAELEAQFASLFEAVVAVRAVRQELIDSSPKEKKKEVSATLAAPFKVVISTGSEALATRLQGQAHILMQMANIEAPAIGIAASPPKPASATAIHGGTIYLALTPGLVDVEKLRLGKEIRNLEQYIPKMEGKLRNENFARNAPPELVAEEKAKLQEAQAKLANLKVALGAL
jgi:valyl-tRNA synthetase